MTAKRTRPPFFAGRIRRDGPTRHDVSAVEGLLPNTTVLSLSLSLAQGQSLEQSGQGEADGLDRVGVVGVVGRALLLEVGPLAHHASPLDVGVANEFSKEVVRVEDVSAVAGQDDQRLIEVLEQELAPLDVTVQHEL